MWTHALGPGHVMHRATRHEWAETPGGRTGLGAARGRVRAQDRSITVVEITVSMNASLAGMEYVCTLCSCRHEVSSHQNDTSCHCRMDLQVGIAILSGSVAEFSSMHNVYLDICLPCQL